MGQEQREGKVIEVRPSDARREIFLLCGLSPGQTAG